MTETKGKQVEYIDHSLDDPPMPQFEKYQNAAPDEMEVHFSKEDFDHWMSKLTTTKFHNYLAWFNINIK